VNIDQYVERLLERKAKEESPILQNQIVEYTDFIKGFVQKNAIMEKVFLVVVPFYPLNVGGGMKSATSSAFSFFGKKKTSAEVAAQTKEDTDRTFQENMAQLNQRTNQAVTGILGMGLEAKILEYEQLVELFYNFYNPQTIERQNMPVPNANS
jgi:hypothetical protein